MMNIDHALDGRVSRQHHEEMIKQAQHSQLVAEARKYQKSLQTNKNDHVENVKQTQPTSAFQQIKRVLVATTNLLVQ